MLREILIYISAFIGLFATTFYFLSYYERRKDKEPEFPKNAPRVTIIIPAYNEEKGIAGSINSALDIDYPKELLEVIVVDDGSKDRTFEIASQFKSKRVRVFKMPKNSGKGAAMNFAISKARGEVIVTMDADNTIVQKDALKKMVAYFNDSKVMCVAPAMAIYNPKGVLQRVQQIEYLFGVFLRKAFSSMNAVHITPGAFSAYKKVFFEKYGGFSVNNLTEDLEMALRIQSHHFVIENSIGSVVYTVAPNKFWKLLKQRRRWYVGLLRNLWEYKRLFSKNYGPLGTIVLPVAISTVFISIALSLYIMVQTLIQIKKELFLMQGINFSLNYLELNWFMFERYFFMVLSKPMFLFAFLFISFLIGYMVFAKRKIKQYSSVRISIIFFLAFFSFLFAFWWIMSVVYTIFNKKVAWR